MVHIISISQSVFSEKSLLAYAGDTLIVELSDDSATSNKASFRSNLEGCWHDREMLFNHATQKYTLRIPLLKKGRFKGKCYFEDDLGNIQWIKGEDIKISIQPSVYRRYNALYTIFPRQFGINKNTSETDANDNSKFQDLEEKGYTILPPSGTFRDVMHSLDHIMDTMRFRILHFMPIHPTPVSYGRMGLYGSPYASMDFFSVDPAYGEFDPSMTPLEQFQELINAIHARKGRVIIDIPANHTGWGSSLHTIHPEWYKKGNGRYLSPGAWGTVWEDLVELDYEVKPLWDYMYEVFFFWIGCGVDGFRLDAGYMLPVLFWKNLVERVRASYPDALFLVEGLGGDPVITENILFEAGINWAYSEFFQNFDRTSVERRFNYEETLGIGEYIRFSETHDNLRLASKSERHSRLRSLVAAGLSHSGGYGITNGVEWFATEKIDVHKAPSLNWGNSPNLVEVFRRINTLLALHPAFDGGAQLSFLNKNEGNTIVLLREYGDECLLLLANLDENNNATLKWKTELFSGSSYVDLITEKEINPSVSGDYASLSLPPEEAMIMTTNRQWINQINDSLTSTALPVDRIEEEIATARLLELPLIEGAKGFFNEFSCDPDVFLDRYVSTYPFSINLPLTKRIIPVPHRSLPIIRHSLPFRVTMRKGNDDLVILDSMPWRKKSEGVVVEHGAFIIGDYDGLYEISTLSYETNKTIKNTSHIRFLPSGEDAVFPLSVEGKKAENVYTVLSDKRSSYSILRADFGKIHSKYDAFFAWNPSPDFPVDKTVLLTRLRGWIRYKDYSFELDRKYLAYFSLKSDRHVLWQFLFPIPCLPELKLRVSFHLDQRENTFFVVFVIDNDSYPTNKIELILRPDVEERNYHESPSGVRGAFQDKIKTTEDGFSYSVEKAQSFGLRMSGYSFTRMDEWIDGIPLRIDEERGMEGTGKIFSPGYFKAEMIPNHPVIIRGGVGMDAPLPQMLPTVSPGYFSLKEEVINSELTEDTLLKACQSSLVKRGDFCTVVAGYPWFLDWGRDALICLRGLISGGFYDEVKDIISCFGKYEKEGTLPNAIFGSDDGNRDTVDASLWFLLTVEEYYSVEPEIINITIEGRTLREILFSIVDNYKTGTQNGIIMDPETGLIYSPAHYTWMDTNFPACTPREGYPIEVQALWYRALSFMGRLLPGKGYKKLADFVRDSIHRLYLIDEGYFSDTLRGGNPQEGGNANKAQPEKALRPNQLFTITLGVVDPDKDEFLCKTILRHVTELLIPGGVRSLADRPTSVPLEVMGNNGETLNDPLHPYWRHYEGDEDTRRKPAYHNGTAWTWLLPTVAEAIYLAGGERWRDSAFSLLLSELAHPAMGALGTIAEIKDGDYTERDGTPFHLPRGCGAQSWSITEMLRVYRILK